ncbi:hypothetical protein J5X84_00525 [Streptosporangiaceae bacterium NEAU-GS5]|nr:hypothetical protein [Streptosporangiaceae bacterium NEAU-GS5]
MARDRYRGVTRDELKTSAVVVVAVLVAVGLVGAWGVLIPGVMVWDNVVVAAIGTLRLTGPVAAAFAAWVALRKRRALYGRPIGLWTALKGPLAVAGVVVGSFGATVLMLTLRAALSEQAGRLLPSGLLMGASGLALYVMIGWVIGWLVPRAITPLPAGIVAYALFAWLAGSGTWAARLAPITRGPYDLFQPLSAAGFLDQSLWLLGAAATLALAWAAVVTRATQALAGAALAMLAATTGLARMVAEPPTTAVAGGHVIYSCQEWPITICVHPGMRAGLGDLGSTFTTLAARLAGTPAAFQRVEQRSRLDSAAPLPGVAPIHVDDLSSGYAYRAAAEFVETLARPCAASEAAGYRAIVVAWLRGEPLPAGPRPELRAAAAWFSALTETQRREWLRMFYTDFATCRLGGAHFENAPTRPGLRVYPVNPSPH